eukprot:TRINITY_DN6617_c0_g1_i1.p1 TRINITY_DN6617_c0_g1~~TRINITY_DN6617_c0_g1_i1.p1  ORF type:complete len:395 (+),score=95.39 TRINITY_DN6617_c0_g1_i1:78-1262(+)
MSNFDINVAQPFPQPEDQLKNFPVFLALAVLSVTIARTFSFSFFSIFSLLLIQLALYFSLHLHINFRDHFFSPSIHVTRLNLHLPDLPSGVEGKKLIALSDIHFSRKERSMTKETMQRLVNMVRAEEPDFVLLLGDLVDNDTEATADLCAYFKQMDVKRGGEKEMKFIKKENETQTNLLRVIAVLGNHDEERGEHKLRSESRDRVISTMRQHGVVVLENEALLLFNTLQVAGLGELWASRFHPDLIFDKLDDRAVLVMSHNPDTVMRIAEKRASFFQLSGHTHGGQISLPVLGPVLPLITRYIDLLVPKRFFELVPWRGFSRVLRHMDLLHAGLYFISSDHQPSLVSPGPSPQVKKEESNSNRWMYVTAGLGISPPFRLFVPPEMVVITLSSKK